MKLKQFDEKPYNGFLIVLLALLKATQQNEADTENEDIEQAIEMFKQDRRFGRHATNIYLASLTFTKSQVADCMEIEPEDILDSWLKDDVAELCPNFVLFLDHQNSEVVLVIRGTLSVNDVITDVLCEEEEFLGGFAHKGFVDGTTRLLEKCGPTLEDTLKDHSDYELVVCGHSMGGSVSVLTTMLLLSEDPPVSLPAEVSVQCVALAPAPVYRGLEEEYTAKIAEKIHVYTYGKDVVPRLSLGSVAKMLVMLRAVDELGISLEEQLRVVMGKEDSLAEINRERIREAVAEAKQDRFPYLYHMGKVMQLGKKDVRTQDEDLTKNLATNIEITDTMLTDHMPLEYKEIFCNLFTS